MAIFLSTTSAYRIANDNLPIFAPQSGSSIKTKSNYRPAPFPWRETPLLRVVLFFGAGIALAIVADFAWAPLLTYLLPVPLVLLGILAATRISFRYRGWFGILLLLALLYWGYASAALRHDLGATHHFIHTLDADSTLSAIVQVDELRVSGERLRVQVTARQLIPPHSAASSAVSGRAYFYTPLSPATEQWRPGTLLALQATVRHTRPPPNPLAFDFSAYLARQNIYYQLQVDTSSLTVLSTVAPSLRRQAEQARQWALQRLRQAVSTPREYGVAAALLLGYRNDLDTEVQSAYANTGAIHILAVSGLHVGILAQVVTWLLLFFSGRQRRFRWLRIVLVVAIIWSFALLTGLSASVSRAALMFSIVAIGELSLGRHHIYNSLAAAALLLLLYQPLWLLDIGFQLSFLAVFGIIYFQPTINRWFYFSWPPLRWGWSLLSIALAAQLATFPLSVYYFHQFPLYFWLSGLVVPLVAPILVVGLAAILLSGVPLLGSVLAALLTGLLFFCNSFIFTIHSLPGGLWQYLFISTGSLLLLFLLLAALAWYQWQRSARAILWGLGLSSILLLMANLSLWQHQQQRELVVYQLYRATLIDFFIGTDRYTISTLPADTATAITWAATNYRGYQGAPTASHFLTLADTIFTPFFAYQAGYGQVGHQRFAIIGDTDLSPSFSAPIHWLLLTQNTRADLPDLLDRLQPANVIIDGNNSPWKAKRWQTICADRGIPCHFTNIQGAWQSAF